MNSLLKFLIPEVKGAFISIRDSHVLSRIVILSSTDTVNFWFQHS